MDDDTIPFPNHLVGWECEGMTLNGRRHVTARRNGITWQFVRDEDGWAAIKLRGGKILGHTATTNKIPPILALHLREAAPICRRIAA